MKIELLANAIQKLKGKEYRENNAQKGFQLIMSDFELSLDWLKVVVRDEIYALWVFERARNANFTERLGNDLVSTCFPLFCVLFFFECEQKEQRQRCNATNDDVGYLIIISTKEEFAREKVILKCDTLVNSKI